jgi:hypothetical protein
MAAKTGRRAKLYYRVGGSTVTDDWTELTRVRNLTLNDEKGTVEVDDRSTSVVGFLIDKRTVGVEFDLTYDATDAGHIALNDAYVNEAALGIAVMDGAFAASTGNGVALDMYVATFTRNENLADPMSRTVKLVRAYGTSDPVEYEDGQPVTATGTAT